MSGVEIFPRYPVFERKPKKTNNALIITMIIVVVLIIVTSIIVYAAFRNNLTNVRNVCEPGLCVVNIGTGQKRCPSSTTEQLEYDVVFEDCTSSNFCQSQRAPCAVQTNGTLNCRGVCGVGNNKCSCQPAPN